ncbi:hypothetical protein KPH14_012988 [Odynerus spinipes]|uniref:Uncharacterized protein n=1 Tax=Odynerus spinipes TaxID=1348599 RepID=A0AAD9VIF4_9HYME|nr:hypothetical protein KPH14_012988 [Odynerus spinipes]
MKLNPEKQ